MVDKKCKYFRHEPYMTSNNYDIYLNPSEIPANIQKENVDDLQHRLQKLMPLGKFIHINFNTDSETMTESNSFDVSTHFKINNKEVNLI
ncbi:hypothetical protein [Methanobrevibacter sp.]|uniref:hypothetical protein n=1 Tax=Methanobrevibacter sp. TaxID=66852 RepID=UPI00388E1A89